MKSRFEKLSVLLLLLPFLAAALGPAACSRPAPPDRETVAAAVETREPLPAVVGETVAGPEGVRVVVVGTNDIHGQIWPLRAFWREETHPPLVGGFPALAYYVGRVREEDEHVIVLDAGDFFQGTPEGDLSLGELPLLAMNHIGFDALALGNHEFDFGVEPVIELAEQADFPFLAANLKVIDPDLPEFFRDYTILERGGVRVLVIGLILETLFGTVDPGLAEYLSVEDLEPAVRRVMAETAGEWDVCLVLSHVGHYRDRELAAAVDGIDFIFGGHCHTGVLEPVEVNSARIVQTFGRNTTAAVLGFGYCLDRGEVTGVDYRLVELDYGPETHDAQLEALLKEASANIRGLMDVEIARSEEGLSRGRGLESTQLGSFVSDLIRETTGADFAYFNRPGIRADLPAGSITRRDIYQTLPFDNTIVVMDMTGAEILHFLSRIYRRGRFSYDFSDGILIVIDEEADPDRRVSEVKIENKPVDPGRLYRVATNSFLATGMASHRPPDNPLPMEDTGISVRDLVEREIVARGDLEYSFASRIVPPAGVSGEMEEEL